MMAHVNGNIGGIGCGQDDDKDKDSGEDYATEAERPAARHGRGMSRRPFSIDTLPFVNSNSRVESEPRPREWSPETQPKPTGLILNHVHTGDLWVASITREWEDPEAAATLCGYCPKDQCQLTERGTCNVQAVTFIASKELAGTFARPGSPAAIAAANAAIAAATGLPLVPGGEDFPR